MGLIPTSLCWPVCKMQPRTSLEALAWWIGPAVVGAVVYTEKDGTVFDTTGCTDWNNLPEGPLRDCVERRAVSV